jgi:hypothetical protein
MQPPFGRSFGVGLAKGFEVQKGGFGVPHMIIV